MPQRSFGQTIKSRRTSLGLSQAKLGELVGRSAATIRSWERNTTRPNDTSVITALSAVLGIDERTLFERANVDPPEVEKSPTVEQALASLSRGPEEPTAVTESPVEERPAAAPSYSLPISGETYIVTSAVPPVIEPSYMEDPDQRRLYQARTIATVAVLVGLAIAFVWALSQGLGSLGVWWDEFFGNLRL